MELHTIGIDLGKTVFHLVRFRMRKTCVAAALGNRARD